MLSITNLIEICPVILEIKLANGYDVSEIISFHAFRENNTVTMLHTSTFRIYNAVPADCRNFIRICGYFNIKQ
jgi:hypothetical protein